MIDKYYNRAELRMLTCFSIAEFKAVTKEICKLPSFFSTVLFQKIDVNGTGFITRYMTDFMIKVSSLFFRLFDDVTSLMFIS